MERGLNYGFPNSTHLHSYVNDIMEIYKSRVFYVASNMVKTTR